MAKIVFSSAVNMSLLDFPAWLGVTPTDASSTSMTFSTPGQVVVISGSGFDYFLGSPIDGVVTGFTGDGLVDVVVTKLNLSIPTVSAVVTGPNPVEDSMTLLIGGHDGIFGSTGADTLTGLAGKDAVKGNKGADVVIGGLGRDVLTGGRGADTFVFGDGESGNGKPDRITDLADNDFIDLSALGVTLGDIAATYDENTDRTTFAVDHKGNSSPDLTIVADGDHLSFDNFILG